MLRTAFSFKTAVGHIPEVISRLQEIGWTIAPIADRNSTFGFARWSKAAIAVGLRPVFGVELAVSIDVTNAKAPRDWWTFLAGDSLEDLNRLIAIATGRQASPALTYAEAMAYRGSKITGPAVLLNEVRAFEADDAFFIGLSAASPRGLINEAIAEGYALCAMPNNFYPRATDLELYRVLLGPRAASSQTYPMHIQSDDEFRSNFDWLDIETAIGNRNLVLDASRATLPKATLLVPEKLKSLRSMCEDGASKLNINLRNDVYGPRLDKELSLIEEKGFEDYFFIIADLMQFARSRMVVGPARGSSCGSLVCYLLGITAIDPIPYGLIFERFIDTTRSDLPDIDIDFSDVRRGEIFDYVNRKYGREHWARLGSVNNMGTKAALNRISEALRIPSFRTDEIDTLTTKRAPGDTRLISHIADTLTDTPAGRRLIEEWPGASIVTRMERHPSNAAQHAAGIVLTAEPIVRFVATDTKTGAVMCDKVDAEDLNLLKIDALGLTQLSIFERTLQQIGKPMRSDVLEAIPLDDARAFGVLNDGKFSGVFQFTGAALQGLARQVKIETLEDMVSITALARPGPLDTGDAQAWVDARIGKAPISNHPVLKPIVENTFGTIVYQEQVMQIVREIGGLSWPDTIKVRKIMGKTQGDAALAVYEPMFLEGATARGLTVQEAQTIWNRIKSFGAYAFNRSHAVAYGIVSYWCCWFKAHHPLEFAAATLDAQSDIDRQLDILRELAREGVGYVPVDVDHSGEFWEVGNGKLVGPVGNIKGIGPMKVIEIMEHRRSGAPLKPGLAKLLSSAKTPIDTLNPVREAAEAFGLKSLGIVTPPTEIAVCDLGSEPMIIAKMTGARVIDENEPARVERRGHELTGPTKALNLFFRDDSGEIFAKVDRHDFDRLAPLFLEKAKKGKTLFAVKGYIPDDFRMLRVSGARKIGDMK